jgi:hypothetical protein
MGISPTVLAPFLRALFLPFNKQKNDNGGVKVMKNQKKDVRKGERPPGKEKAPTPRPAPSSVEPTGEDETLPKPKERDADDKVIAPDGEPEPKKKRTPLF